MSSCFILVRPSATGELKVMAGKGFRNPTIREMYLYPTSNDELRPERLTTYELSWRQRPAGGVIDYGVNLFYIDGDNIIQTVNRKNINTGKIYNSGIEADATYRVTGRLTLTTNHGLLHMEHPVVSAPRYKGYLGAHYRHGRWAITAGVQHISGLYTETGNDESTESFTLLNATVSHQLNPTVRIWAKGDNLLARQYETNKGYPMPRATFMGGVNISF